MIDQTAKVRILYPDKKMVTIKVVIGWAVDAWENGEIETKPKTFALAVGGLEDSGLVTFHKSIDPILQSSEAFEEFPAEVLRSAEQRKLERG